MFIIKIPLFSPIFTAAPSGIARAIAERGLNPPAEEAVGGSSQVPPPSNQITSPVDSYKEQLRLQVTVIYSSNI